MSDTPWTPGPWEPEDLILHGKNYGPSGVRTADENNVYVIKGSGGARSYSRTIVQFPWGYSSDPIQVANARLIAAAPAMAEALIECERALRNMPGNWPTQLHDKVCAALAAARGEKPEALARKEGR